MIRRESQALVRIRMHRRPDLSKYRLSDNKLSPVCAGEIGEMSGLDGPIVLCFGVVDEADIVRDFLDYHLSLGIERFVATDTGSTDGTLDILAEYDGRGGCI